MVFAFVGLSTCLVRSCFSHSFWNVVEFFVGEIDLRMFIASLKLSIRDLSGE